MVLSLPVRLFDLISDPQYDCVQWHMNSDGHYFVLIADNKEFARVISCKKSFWNRDLRLFGFKNCHKGRSIPERKTSTLYLHAEFTPLSTHKQLEGIQKQGPTKKRRKRSSKYNKKPKPVNFAPSTLFDQDLPAFLDELEGHNDTIGFFTDDAAQVAQIPPVCSFDQLFIDEYSITDLMNCDLLSPIQAPAPC